MIFIKLNVINAALSLVYEAETILDVPGVVSMAVNQFYVLLIPWKFINPRHNNAHARTRVQF